MMQRSDDQSGMLRIVVEQVTRIVLDLHALRPFQWCLKHRDAMKDEFEAGKLQPSFR